MNFVAATVVIGLAPIIAVSKVMHLWYCVKKSDRILLILPVDLVD